MKTVVIKEYDEVLLPSGWVLDLGKKDIKDCCGCWTCWWKTPGKCAFKELDEFYHEYVTSDKAVFFAKVKNGFVSGNMKTLFDRMIPLFLSYTSVSTGESMHVMRYDKYPDIEFYYDGDFATEEGRKY